MCDVLLITHNAFIQRTRLCPIRRGEVDSLFVMLKKTWAMLEGEIVK